MRFSTPTTLLREAVGLAGGAVPSKSTLPILDSIFFERDGDRLRLTSTDLEISVIKHVPVMFDDGGTAKTRRIAVPATKLQDTLRKLPDVPLTFHADENFAVTLRTETGMYKMLGFDGADYPALPDMKEGTVINADGASMRRALQKTGFAVSKDSLRPAMSGIYFQIDADGTRVVATDGHRLVRLSLHKLTSSTAISFILPYKAMDIVGRGAEDGPCTITFDGNYLSFDFTDLRILSRRIDETYPNYEAVIPLDNNRRMTVDRQALIASALRVGLYSSKSTQQIRMRIAKNTMTVSAEDIERSSEAKEEVSCEHSGEDYQIGFNGPLLTEALKVLDSEHVLFNFGSPKRAGILKPLEQQADEEILVLVMPVMLNTYA